MHRPTESHEWLEADGLGGFAMGTAAGVRTRRYHSLLTASLRPPVDRVALVKGLDAWIETPEGTWGLTTQRYVGGHEAPDGTAHLVEFDAEPWPTWKFRLPSGLTVHHEIFMVRGRPLVCASWRIIGPPAFARLSVRPLLAAIDMHALRRDADALSTEVQLGSHECIVRWNPDARCPQIVGAAVDGAYAHDPVVYRGLLYTEERARGFDHVEDLLSPGTFRWDLAEGEGVLMMSAGVVTETSDQEPVSIRKRFESVRTKERAARENAPTRLDAVADKFIAARADGKTIIAGYPWFGDWGRDTFIAMRGLCLARGKWDEARQILTNWAGTVSQGMLPNRFTDSGDTPEYNAVDASLWYVVAAGEYLDAVDGWKSAHPDPTAIRSAITAILEGYSRGTRYHIRVDEDGLLAAGEPGVQLTWMDARVNGIEVTPRTGKPVEVQVLWANALHFGAKIDAKWARMLANTKRSFAEKFWNDARSCLFDVVDADHVRGRTDAAIRPNQIFAVGGLPIALLEGPRALKVVECVERALLTPVGLRSLAPSEPGYTPRYEGTPTDRDGAYHQGTVWPWLMGAFVEAWVRVRGSTEPMLATARTRFLAPLEAMLNDGGLGGIAEIYDAEPPRLVRGCPFQAWSVGEAIRISKALHQVGSDRTANPSGPHTASRIASEPAVPFS